MQRKARGATGPRTAEGKTRSSRNALCHGLLSREAILPGESREDHDRFRRRLWRALAPSGELEGLLADRVVSSAWRLRRVLQVESQAFEGRSRGIEGERLGLGGTFVSRSVNGDTFTKLSRYETAIERGLFRALHELQRLQAARGGATVSVPAVVDVDISVARSHEDPR
jgi:hypothetical protein